MAQKEGDEIVVGGNNDDTSCVVPIAARRYEEHLEYQPLVAALKSRKYGGNLGRKKEILLKFRPSELDDVERYCRDLWMSHGRYLFDDIRCKSTKDSDINKIKMEFVAESLAELYVLHQWIKEMPPDDRRLSRQDPSAMVKKAFASLTRYVGPILKKYQEDQAKKTSTKSKVNLQQSGTLLPVIRYGTGLSNHL